MKVLYSAVPLEGAEILSITYTGPTWLLLSEHNGAFDLFSNIRPGLYAAIRENDVG